MVSTAALVSFFFFREVENAERLTDQHTVADPYWCVSWGSGCNPGHRGCSGQPLPSTQKQNACEAAQWKNVRWMSFFFSMNAFKWWNIYSSMLFVFFPREEINNLSRQTSMKRLNSVSTDPRVQVQNKHSSHSMKRLIRNAITWLIIARNAFAGVWTFRVIFLYW